MNYHRVAVEVRELVFEVDIKRTLGTGVLGSPGVYVRFSEHVATNFGSVCAGGPAVDVETTFSAGTLEVVVEGELLVTLVSDNHSAREVVGDPGVAAHGSAKDVLERRSWGSWGAELGRGRGGQQSRGEFEHYLNVFSIK